MDSNPQIPESDSNGQPLTQRKSEFEKLFDQPITFAHAIYKGLYRPGLEEALTELPEQQRKEFLKDVERYLEPWPKWVLKIAAEILHVYLPRIPTQTIEAMLRCYHSFFLEVKIGGDAKPEFPKFPDIGGEVFGAMCGHMAALIVEYRKKAEAAHKEGILSKERLNYYSEGLSLEKFQTDLATFLSGYFGMRPTEIVAFNLGFAKAMQNTFATDGQLRETSLTEIYSEIVSDWPSVYELSGPTALCEYLGPLLRGSGNDPAQKLDRVNKICQRMEITFKPFVNGQAHPPGSSVAPS